MANVQNSAYMVIATNMVLRIEHLCSNFLLYSTCTLGIQFCQCRRMSQGTNESFKYIFIMIVYGNIKFFAKNSTF